MEKEITRFLLAFFGVASLSLLTVRPLPTGDVSVTSDDAAVGDTGLIIGTRYELKVTDRTRYDINDSLSWRIGNLFTGQSSYFLNNTVKEHTFTDTGTYEVRAFKDMKEIARDTLLVGVDELFRIGWPDKSEIVLGSDLSAEDLSTRVASRTWKVTHAGAAVALSEPDTRLLEWEPQDTGTYVVEIEVELESGKVERAQKTFRVNPAPPAPIAEVKPVVKPEPLPKKEPWKPKETAPPPPPPSNSSECFLSGKRLEGSNFWVEVDKPERSQVQFSNEPTRFTVSPIKDCMFAGFDYFADSKIDDIEIEIRCTSPTCSGTAVWKKRIKGGYDAHKEASASFTSPVLNKDLKYMVTITPLAPGKLGYFQTKGNKFTSEKDGSTIRNKEVSLQIHDMKTCVYHLRFTR